MPQLLRTVLRSSVPKTLPVFAARPVIRTFQTTPKFLSNNRLFSTMSALVQRPAPAFSATAVVDGQFKKISLSDYKGKWLILFFYPLGE